MKRIQLITAIVAMLASAQISLALISDGGRNTYDLNDGLSNGYVTSMAEDSKGNIWVATESGLNRFDGKRFINYTKENSGLPANELNVVAQDPDNADWLWVATQRDGMRIFSHEKQEFIQLHDERLWPSNVVDIKPAVEQGVWITDYHFGAHYYNAKNNELRKYNHSTVKGLPYRSYSCVEAQDGTLYIGHVSEGLSAVDTTKHTFTNFRMGNSPLPGDCVYEVMRADNGFIWIGTDNGAALLNPWTHRITPFVSNTAEPSSLAPGAVRRIVQLKNGDILFATARGGTCMLRASGFDYSRPEEASFTHVAADSRAGAMECMNVRSLLEDSYGNIWIGHYHAGVNVITHIKPMFRREGYARSLPQGWVYPPVWSCIRSRDGDIWTGSDGEITRLGKNAASYSIPGMNDGNKSAVTAMAEEDNGNLIVGTTDQGAFRFETDSGKFQKIGGIPANIRSIFKDTDGTILITTDNNIWKLSGDKAEELNVADGLGDHVIQCLERDAAGNLWVGTFGKGIDILSPDLKVKTRLKDATGFISNAVNHIIKDSKGRMWVATRNGVAMFDKPSDPSRFKVVIDPAESGISHIKALAEDKEGNIWATSDKCVISVNGENLTLTQYRSNNDVALNSFSERGVAVSPRGKIYLASANGLVSVNTRDSRINNKDIPVVLSDFTAYKEGDNRKGNEISIKANDGKISLPRNLSMFRITFAIPDQGIMKYSSFAYKMEGYDDVWIELHNENSVTFRNLPPGKYRFLVRFKFKGNEWSAPREVVKITIPPPIWFSWWAVSIYVILAAGIIFIIGYLYVRRVRLKERLLSEMAQNRERESLNEERLRFFTNITHELRTPLTLILGPIEDMVSDPALPQKYNVKLRMIRESSKSLLSLINGILEFRKTETHNRELIVAKGNISNLVYETGLRFKELNTNKDVEFILDVDKDAKEIYFDREMISTMLNNILSNAVKYTRRGSIVLTLRQKMRDDEERTEISVADTGFGMTKDEITKIFKRYYQINGTHQASGTGIGLALVKNLADIHQAEIIVDSEEGSGSTFIISLLTENLYPEAVHVERKPQPQQPEEDDDTGDDPDNENAKTRILVVEDNDDIRQYICQSLEPDYEIASASNGLEGLKAVHDFNPDIVVSDIMMPEMDGIQLCSRIKEDILTSHITVILLTAKDSLNDRESGYESGADSYLTKPFSARLLRRRISNLTMQKERLAKRLVKEYVNNAPEEASGETRQPEPEIHLSALDRKFIEQIRIHVCENLADQSLDMKVLADKMCMSYSTLYRKSKSILGITMLEYIRGIRMAKAKEMIEEGELTISEIAYAVGYGGHSSFGKIFRKEFGMSPSEYQAKCRGKVTNSVNTED